MFILARVSANKQNCWRRTPRVTTRNHLATGGLQYRYTGQTVVRLFVSAFQSQDATLSNRAINLTEHIYHGQVLLDSVLHVSVSQACDVNSNISRD